MKPVRLTSVLLACAISLTFYASSACEEPADPCDEFVLFAEALEGRCGIIAWDCEAVYGTLGPAAQQDLDWCLDCVRAEEEGVGSQSCEAAPLSGEDCGGLLARTLDATCLATP